MSRKQASYLPHLDGLRAVALLGVLFFHFEVPHFQGGFIGVDVFLTLSGYLITRNLLHSAAQKALSLRSFYFRRFFRLYPASSVVVLFTVLVSYALFAPNFSKEVSQSALASQLFSSNIFFYKKANYFEKKSIMRPLLHTWSLSLEEQFYFLWAPFLYLVLAIPYNALQISILFILTISSFLFASYAYLYDYSFMFYMLPSRVFQFAIGALLTFLQNATARNVELPENYSPFAKEDGLTDTSIADQPQGSLDGESLLSHPHEMNFAARHRSKFFSIVNNIIALTSLVTLLSSYIMLPKAPSPLHTLPVTFATAALIRCQSTILSRFLSLPLMVFIGSLTYSAYLVHWPLWVYMRYLFLILDVDGTWKPHPILMIVLTFAAAILLRYLVEQPLRKGNRLATIWVAFLLITTVGISAFGIRSNGFRFRLNGTINDVSKLESDLRQRNLPVLPLGGCHDRENFFPSDSSFSKISCQTGSRTGPALRNIIVMGNSFTSMLLPALDLIGKEKNVSFPVWFAYRCEFRAPGRETVDYGKLRCKDAIHTMWDRIRQLPQNSTVVFSSFWNYYSVENACTELSEIDKELVRLGLNGAIFPEPPGIHPRYERFYNCIDSMRLPIRSFLKWWGKWKQWKELSSCGTDVWGGIEPSPQSFQFEKWYHSCPHFEALNVLSLSEKICMDVTESSAFKWVDIPAQCIFPNSSVVPPGINDLGYERALFHMSTYGVYRLHGIIRDFLTPYLP